MRVSLAGWFVWAVFCCVCWPHSGLKRPWTVLETSNTVHQLGNGPVGWLARVALAALIIVFRMPCMANDVWMILSCAFLSAVCHMACIEACGHHKADATVHMCFLCGKDTPNCFFPASLVQYSTLAKMSLLCLQPHKSMEAVFVLPGCGAKGWLPSKKLYHLKQQGYTPAVHALAHYDRLQQYCKTTCRPAEV